MAQPNLFSGLTMPVFSAFGWTGEEAAISFALDQLQLFIDALFYSLPREVQAQFPVHGVDAAAQLAYLAVNDDPETDLYIAFLTRPLNLEISLIITEKSALSRVYRKVKIQPAEFLEHTDALGPEWSLRIQQMQYDGETKETTHFKDLYKDSAKSLSETEAVEIIERAEYLNGEEFWVVPLYLSQRMMAEKVAVMGEAILSAVVQQINVLMPIATFLTGQVRKKQAKTKKAEKVKSKAAAPVAETTIRQPLDSAQLGKFTYVSELKPMHIRRGFINLTSNHWPFFALNARTETRPVQVKYGDKIDHGCAVWRLVPNDQARLMLSLPVHMWLEETFDADDRVQVSAIKKDESQIHIELSPA